jgi:glutamine synthetase
VKMYSTVKRVEQDRYQATVPSVDFDWYLRTC